MSKETTVETTLPLANTKNGIISVSQIKEPYGAGSGTVASIGISLAGDAAKPDWKVHIPFENLDAVITALQKLH
jgi:hypothetical protein